MNPFVIFGFIMWVITTIVLVIGGIGAALDGLDHSEGGQVLAGVGAFTLGVLSVSFFIATIQ